MPGNRRVERGGLCLLERLGGLAGLTLASMLWVLVAAGGPVHGSQAESNATAEAAHCATPRVDVSPKTVDDPAASRPSDALRMLADQSNALRVDMRAEQDRSSAFDDERARRILLLRTLELGDRILALPREPATARVLAHVERTLATLDPDGDSVERNEATRVATARWLAHAIGSAEAHRDSERAARLGMRLADLYESSGALEEALELNRRGLLAASRTQSGELLYSAHWRIGRIQHVLSHDEEALTAYRAAVSVLERMRAALAGLSEEQEFTFRKQVEPVYLGLVDLLLATPGPSEESSDRESPRRRPEQQRLSEARDTLERLKIAELRDYFRDECLDAKTSVVPDDIPNTVVVYPVLLPDRVEIIVGRDGRLSSHRSEVDGPTLEAAVRDFRRSLEDRTTRGYRPRGERLYDWLIRPIEARLDDRVETLVFVPSGPLRSIPLAALRDRESGRFLIERFPIAVTPGLRLTEPRRFDRTRPRLLAGALSQSVQGFAALPGVAREVASIEESFESRTLLDEAFRTEAFLPDLEATPFDIVHIASHGEFSADSSESFVLTYDGRIAIDRLSESILRTRFREDHPLEMLVLSACETAAGDERAALGLAGVAVRSGARSVLASLWSVGDDASSRLIARFYSELAGSGISRARALQRAQLELLRERRTEHPALWAPFVFIGSWL